LRNSDFILQKIYDYNYGKNLRLRLRNAQN